jgi:hypothetical protein
MRLTLSVAGWLLALGVLLSGCSRTEPPRQQPIDDYKTQAPLADTSNIVFVSPVAGVDGSAALILADALAASLRDAARPAVISASANTLGPTLFGSISQVRTRGTVAWVTANWELRAPYGEPVARISHEVVVDRRLWAAAGVEAVNLIIAEAEPHVIGMVADYVGPLTALQDVAMPPSERIQMPSGKSQAVEQTDNSLSPQRSGQPREQSSQGSSGNEQADVGEQPTTTELRVLEAEGELSELLEPQPEPSTSTPVRLVPKGALSEQDEEPEELDEFVETEITDDQALDSVVGENEISKPEADARELTDKLLEMADLPEEDPVPDNTKLKPVVWGNPSFLVRIVSGAPGDGNESLTSSIKNALRDKDMTVTEDPRQAAYEIKGRVVVGPPVNGRQQALIVWRVNTMSGDEVGKAEQENTIIAGSLDGEWGRVATIVSDAAVTGIQELFDGKSRRPRPEGVVEFPSAPPLPQVPGRAPPPDG